MLENEEISLFSYDEFIVEFNKKFKNFCNKAPILLSYKILFSVVHIYRNKFIHNKYEWEKAFEYTFDFERSVKENIYFIRKILINDFYPILLQREIIEISYNAEDLHKKVLNGEISINDISAKGVLEEKETIWRIERIIVVRDECFIRNLSSNKIFRYKLKMPITIFLKKLREDLSDINAWELFISKAILLNEIDEDGGVN